MVTLGDVLVDRYRVDAPLGSGGMASVFRAHDLRLGRDVAVKVLLPHLASDPTVVARFEREARALAAVRHPNVIGVFDVEDADASGRPPFLVLELADGGTLAERLRSSGHLDRRELSPLVGAVAAGLEALHAAGLVHRDVKPANVLFADGVPKLGDLGIARWTDPSAVTTEAGITTDGGVLGTLRYLPPEALSGSSPGPAGDAFGLAALAFEALTGRPVRGGSSLATIAAAATAIVPAPSVVAPFLGTAFDGLFAAALSPDPSARPDPTTFARRFADAASAGPAAGHADADDETVVRAVARPSSLALDPAALAVSPPGGRARSRPADARPGSRDRGSSRGLAVTLLFLGAAALVVMAMVVAFANAGRDGLGVLIPTTSPSASVSGSPSPSASLSPSASPAASPTAEPTPDPALDEAEALRTAIAGARGGKDGLKEPEARDLDDRLDRILVELANHDRDAARRLAEELEKRVEKLDVKGDRGERLTEAAHDLVEALGGD